VDRPNEVDIRIFPKYDDAEIIKVGNPGLRPQFTNSLELGFKKSWQSGYLYAAAYHRFADGTITRISSTVPGSTLIYAIFQNVKKSYNTGVELVLTENVGSWYSFTVNLNGYRNQIDAFTVQNLYPVPNTFSATQQEIYSGNLKLNNLFHFKHGVEAQLTAIYLAPDLIPQGKIYSRLSIDIGIKKVIQKGKGELFFNATDLLNTLVIKKQIQGDGFHYTSNDYCETQVVRLGYNYKF
jgi:outer membrane receptor protein involved in Fe transport